MSGLDDLIKGVTGGQGGGGLGDLIGGLAGGGSAGGLGDILGGLAGGSGKTGAGALPGGMGGLLGSLLPVIGGMLAGGGLQKVIAGFQENGLSAQADSWVGTGENAPISGADVRKAVGEAELSKIAAQLGVSEDEAADAVAQVLPTVIDTVSPDGHLAPDSELDAAFESLEHLGEG